MGVETVGYSQQRDSKQLLPMLICYTKTHVEGVEMTTVKTYKEGTHQRFNISQLLGAKVVAGNLDVSTPSFVVQKSGNSSIQNMAGICGLRRRGHMDRRYRPLLG